MEDKFKKSLTEGNRLDAKNLAELLFAISGVAKDFALQLMPYGITADKEHSQNFDCRECIRRKGR